MPSGVHAISAGTPWSSRPALVVGRPSTSSPIDRARALPRRALRQRELDRMPSTRRLHSAAPPSPRPRTDAWSPQVGLARVDADALARARLPWRYARWPGRHPRANTATWAGGVRCDMAADRLAEPLAISCASASPSTTIVSTRAKVAARRSADPSRADHAAFDLPFALPFGSRPPSRRFRIRLRSDFASDFDSDFASAFASDLASLAAPSRAASPPDFASPVFSSFLPGDEYRSGVQPLPLSTNEVREISRFTCGRGTSAGPDRVVADPLLCPNSCPHFSHAYS